MSFWSRLWSAPDAVSKGMDAVINAGDALVFTDEEKSRAQMQLMELRLKAAEATHGSRLARRLLAVMFCAVFLFLVLVCALFAVLAAYTCVSEAYCAASVAQDKVTEISTSAAMGGSVVAIISWYFWSGVKRVDQ